MSSVSIRARTCTSPIGKVSFDNEKLFENLAALMDAIRKARPAAAKGIYIRRMTITSTMGPGIRMDANQALALEDKE